MSLYSRKQRGYLLLLGDNIINSMTNDFKDSCISLENYVKMDKIMKEKLFWEIFDKVDVECMNLKTENEQRNETYIELFSPQKQELIENKRYITLLMDLFETECEDFLIEFHLFNFEI